MFVFLHGFLGQKEDWDPVLAHLPKDQVMAIDLPSSLEKVREKVPKADVLVGYSAGGRIALHLKMLYPEDYGRVIALSAHTHKKNPQTEWIKMLEEAPLDDFLDKWYDLPLFHSLKSKPDLFAKMLERRKSQDPKHLVRFLKNFGPEKLPSPQIFPGTHFLYGEEDLKYAELYRTLPSLVTVTKIPNAGHAVHLENPKTVAGVIYEQHQCTGN